VDVVAGGQLDLAGEALVVDAGAVEAVEVADAPQAVGAEDLGVFAAAQLVLEDDAVGRGPAQGIAVGGGQGEHVAAAVVAPHHEESGTVCGHGRATRGAREIAQGDSLNHNGGPEVVARSFRAAQQNSRPRPVDWWAADGWAWAMT